MDCCAPLLRGVKALGTPMSTRFDLRVHTGFRVNDNALPETLIGPFSRSFVFFLLWRRFRHLRQSQLRNGPAIRVRDGDGGASELNDVTHFWKSAKPLRDEAAGGHDILTFVERFTSKF